MPEISVMMTQKHEVDALFSKRPVTIY